MWNVKKNLKQLKQRPEMFDGTILLILIQVKPTSACTSGDALFRMYSFVASFFSRLDENNILSCDQIVYFWRRRIAKFYKCQLIRGRS